MENVIIIGVVTLLSFTLCQLHVKIKIIKLLREQILLYKKLKIQSTEKEKIYKEIIEKHEQLNVVNNQIIANLKK